MRICPWLPLLLLLVAPLAAASECPVDPASMPVKRGKLLYFQCIACHALTAEEPAKVGPHLHALLDRPAAAVEGFAYSAPLAAAGFAWTRDKLDAFLRAPQELVPGSTMAFAGIARDSDRQALIDYMVVATSPACAAP
jgi:cytochrome c